MLCVKSRQTIEDTIKKSRFIGTVFPCTSESEVVHSLQTLQSNHPNASHIAFAYRIKTDNGIVMRFHDAGEPGGTAGKPILQHLEGKGLINVLIAVTRYFGGIRLGAGGLTRAYGNAAKNVIDAATVVEYIDYETINLHLEYKQMQSFEYQLNKLDGQILKQDFSENIEIVVRLPKDNTKILTQLFNSTTMD